MTELQISTHKNTDGTLTISPQGIIDAYSRSELEEAFDNLFKEKTYHFAVDLSGVDYMSSAGISIFIGALNKVQENNGSMKLTNIKPAIKQLFELVGLTQLFPIG